MSTGYKEWLGVCAHLEKGTSSLLLRKGGIHEGQAGFSFAHKRFFLYATSFHDDDIGLREPAPPCEAVAADEEKGVSIRILAVANWAHRIRDKAIIDALAPHHVWTPEIVDQRFNYSEKLEADCLSIAFVRIYRLPAPWSFPWEKDFGGCRSWIDLPEPPADWEEGLTPVVDDTEQARRENAILDILGGH